MRWVPNTGAQLWAFKTGNLVWSSPAAADEVVYFGSFDGNVYALEAHRGSLLWSYSIGANVTSSPVIANAVVYVTSWDNNIYAFYLSGSEQGKAETVSERPDTKTLRPDLSLKLSEPGAEL